MYTYKMCIYIYIMLMADILNGMMVNNQLNLDIMGYTSFFC